MDVARASPEDEAVVEAWAYRVPSAATSRPSASDVVRPAWRTVPTARTAPVLVFTGRHEVHLDFQRRVGRRRAGRVVCTAQPIAESRSVAANPPCTMPIGL